jgi:hypothetical protein
MIRLIFSAAVLIGLVVTTIRRQPARKPAIFAWGALAVIFGAMVWSTKFTTMAGLVAFMVWFGALMTADA